jgi:hypothetical protein
MKTYSEPTKNYKGMWVTEVKDATGRVVRSFEWTTKKGLLTKLKEMGFVKANTKCCMVCGNTKKAEIELQTLYSDEDGNEAEQAVYICKEEKGCNK